MRTGCSGVWTPSAGQSNCLKSVATSPACTTPHHPFHWLTPHYYCSGKPGRPPQPQTWSWRALPSPGLAWPNHKLLRQVYTYATSLVHTANARMSDPVEQLLGSGLQRPASRPLLRALVWVVRLRLILHAGRSVWPLLLEQVVGREQRNRR